MAGKPGKSGGKREGAGAKPGTSGGARPGAGRPPASFRIKLGDVFAVRDDLPDGSTPLEVGEVTEITRTKIVIKTNTREVVIVR